MVSFDATACTHCLSRSRMARSSAAVSTRGTQAPRAPARSARARGNVPRSLRIQSSREGEGNNSLGGWSVNRWDFAAHFERELGPVPPETGGGTALLAGCAARDEPQCPEDQGAECKPGQ